MHYLIPPFIILLAFSAYGLLHSILASTGAKQWAGRKFGEDLSLRTYRLAFNLVAVVSLLPIVFLVLWLPDLRLYSLPPALAALFFLVQLIGLLFIVSSLGLTDILDFVGLRQLGKMDRTPRLVVDGIYRYVRHPLYTGSMLILWLIPSMTVNWLAFILGMSVYFIIGARYEERRLEKFYGKAYRDYKKRTPAFLPWPRKAADKS